MRFAPIMMLVAALSWMGLRMVRQAWRGVQAAPPAEGSPGTSVVDAGARRRDALAQPACHVSGQELPRALWANLGSIGHVAGVATARCGADPHFHANPVEASVGGGATNYAAVDTADDIPSAEFLSESAPVFRADESRTIYKSDTKQKILPLRLLSRKNSKCFGRLATISLASPLLSGCAALNHGMLAAGGPVMAQERHLFLVVGFIMLFVIGPVLLLTPLFAWHYRLSNTKSAYRPEWGFSWTLEFLIWIPPSIIVIILGFFLWNYTHALDPYKPLASDKPALRVQAVSLDWKWLFIYPDEGVATINDLVFPADRPVHLYLTSGTVMQSLLLPRLAGQIYAMAGMTTELNFAADAPGEFRGENVQYSGDGFPHEKFPIHALSPGDYGKWLADTRADKRSLDFAGYKHLVAVREPSEPQVFGSVAPNLFQGAVNQNMPGVRSADMDKKNTMNGMDMKDAK